MRLSFHINWSWTLPSLFPPTPSGFTELEISFHFCYSFLFVVCTLVLLLYFTPSYLLVKSKAFNSPDSQRLTCQAPTTFSGWGMIRVVKFFSPTPRMKKDQPETELDHLAMMSSLFSATGPCYVSFVSVSILDLMLGNWYLFCWSSCKTSLIMLDSPWLLFSLSTRLLFMLDGFRGSS